jgi:formylglycine-generating enzyme required for sulfatase activity
MHGNVWERVEDRYHAHYQGAPNDGSAWVEGENAGRVLRGGGWSDEVMGTRTAYRDVNGPGLCYRTAGFRLAHSADD